MPGMHVYRLNTDRLNIPSDVGKSDKKSEVLRNFSSSHRLIVRSPGISGTEGGTDFDPEAVLFSLVEELSPEAEDRGVELLTSSNLTTPITLSGDPRGLRESLRRLVCTELYSRNGGWISMGLFSLPDVARETSSLVRFSIQSAGMDTPPRYIPVTINNSRSLRRSAWASGETVFQESDGRGWSHIFFDLKFHRSVSLPEGAGSENNEEDFLPEEIRPWRVLLVQEDGFIRNATQRILEDLGGTVVSLDPEQVAGDHIEENVGDIIILDTAITHGSAEDILLRFRMDQRFRAFHSIPLLVLTAHALDGRMRKLFPYGVDEFIFKPVGAKNLKDAVVRALKRRKQQDGLHSQEDHSSSGSRFTPAEISEIRIMFSSHPELLEEISALFPAEACRHLLEMKKLIRAADYFGIAYAAGCLISDAAVVGLCGITEHLRAIVQAARHKDMKRILSLYPQIPGDVLRIAWILRKATGGRTE